MAAVVRHAARDLRSLRRRAASETARLRARAATARDLGGVAAQPPQALQADLADVVVPSGSGAHQPASGTHLFAVPAAARSAHRDSPRPARGRARPFRAARAAAAAGGPRLAPRGPAAPAR